MREAPPTAFQLLLNPSRLSEIRIEKNAAWKPAWHRLAAMRAPPLFGLAPGGVYRAAPVASRAVRSYRTLSPLPGTGPGGLLSVALSLGSPPPDVIRHRVSEEPGLSSACPNAAVIQPTGDAQ